MDAAGAADAKNAPTAPWKTAQTAVSHSAHTHHRLVGEGSRALTVTASHTKSRTVPRATEIRTWHLGLETYTYTYACALPLTFDL